MKAIMPYNNEDCIETLRKMRIHFNIVDGVIVMNNRIRMSNSFLLIISEFGIEKLLNWIGYSYSIVNNTDLSLLKKSDYFIIKLEDKKSIIINKDKEVHKKLIQNQELYHSSLFKLNKEKSLGKVLFKMN